MPSRFSVSKLRSPQHSTAAVELLRERDPKNDPKNDQENDQGNDQDHEQKSDPASVARLLSPLSLPRHLAVIMDGNGRWAKARGKSRLEGHKAGANAAERILDYVLKKGIPYLTLFAFSSENWRRSDEEVQGLMRLLEHYLVRNRKSFLEDRRVRLSVFGDKTKLPSSLVVHLDDLERESQAHSPAGKSNSNGKDRSNEKEEKANFLHLGLALNYGGRDDIVRATRRLVARCLQEEKTKAADMAEKLTEQHISAALDTASFPDPDLLIRTGGEQRISNFLLWQCAYSELMFTDCPWPDFNEERLESMLEAFARRERRFGASDSRASRRA